MDYVVVDTDVATLLFRRRLSAQMAARLVGKTLCVTFVSVGEMTLWAELRRWDTCHPALVVRAAA